MSKPQSARNVDVPLEILKELLTPSELRMLKNRWQIVNLLQDGLSIRSIAEKVKVGTDTVVRVAKMMQTKGSGKLSKDFKKNRLSFKTNTPWIFGKSD